MDKIESTVLNERDSDKHKILEKEKSDNEIKDINASLELRVGGKKGEKVDN